MQKIGYKVIQRGDKGSITNIKGARVYYSKNQMTLPNEGYGPLSVFKDKISAENFCNILNPYYGDELIIISCEYEKSEQEYTWIPPPYCIKRKLEDEVTPCGTDFADKVKII